MPSDSQPHRPHRGFGLWQSTAMNMSYMVGIGPFLTIPLIIASMGGPQAMLGWLLGAVLAICDGMVWAELASAIPSSGGTLEYLKVAFAGTRLGRLLPFLFIWQFILSGPLEISTGNIGIAQYVSYVVKQVPPHVELAPIYVKCLAVGVAALMVFLLYRKIESVGKLMVVLWAGMIVTIAAVLIPGVCHFDAGIAFDFPPEAFSLSSGFALGLGTAMSIAMYDFLGYYGVCYIGEEVVNPSRIMPRSILISVIAVAAIYLTMNLCIIGVVPWREAMESKFIASDFMEKLYGPTAGTIITVLICWTAFAAIFAGMLGYSRIPYVAARDGFFFAAFGRLHPRGDFPHISLLVLGAVSIGASFLSLGEVIDALLTTRILVQFVAQIVALALIRKQGRTAHTFRMALYPLPSIIAEVGWLFVFATRPLLYIAVGLGTPIAGVGAYFVWSWWQTRWPKTT